MQKKKNNTYKNDDVMLKSISQMYARNTAFLDVDYMCEKHPAAFRALLCMSSLPLSGTGELRRTKDIFDNYSFMCEDGKLHMFPRANAYAQFTWDDAGAWMPANEDATLMLVTAKTLS